MLKPIDNMEVKTKIQHRKMRGSLKCFSYDEGIKESQTFEHKESCDTTKGIKTDNASPKEKHSKSGEQVRKEHTGETSSKS